MTGDPQSQTAGDQQSQSDCVPPIAVTMGEPAGIGGELTLQAWAYAQDHAQTGSGEGDHFIPQFFAVDSPGRLAALARQVGIDAPVIEISDPAETTASWPKGVPVLAGAPVQPVAPGAPDAINAAAVIRAIEKAVELTQKGAAAAVVTQPIQKETLYDGGFAYSGHTDFLAALAREYSQDQVDSVMMIAAPGLRVIPVTIHQSLTEAIRTLDTTAIVHCGRVVHRALQERFGIANPAIAVAGLNPHAGEGGNLGREEIDIIRPALDELAGERIELSGPFASDTLFRAENRDRLDAIICMYHDQALIPVKTLDFWHTVNITLGLPFVRTSPGHGTGLDLAGTGTARPTSFIAALQEAARQVRAASASAKSSDRSSGRAQT